MKTDNSTDYEYVLVHWPESQILMDYDWFNEDASLADCDKFGSSAYFIPKNRWLELHNEPETDSAGFTAEDR